MQNPTLPLETFVSVDVETAGPNPSRYSLLSIGACLVVEPEHTFYVELKPVNASYDPQSLAVSGFSLHVLRERGVPPAQALSSFEQWLSAEIPPDHQPILVGFNAPFDWMFVNDYFHRFLGRNPFGHTALDIKALYMGLHGGRWSETTMRHLAPQYLSGSRLSHNALQDAQDQALLFRKILDEIKTRAR